jgi:hypothetical protein
MEPESAVTADATPIGTAPRTARWPLLVTGALWLVWLGFLMAMVVWRTCSIPL